MHWFGNILLFDLFAFLSMKSTWIQDHNGLVYLLVAM